MHAIERIEHCRQYSSAMFLNSDFNLKVYISESGKENNIDPEAEPYQFTKGKFLFYLNLFYASTHASYMLFSII